VFHEFGHWSDCGLKRRGHEDFDLTYLAIKEAYACLSGWTLGEEYYGSLNWTKTNVDDDPTGNYRQDWVKTDTSQERFYLPLYIDLVDDYNQHTSSSSPRPDDQIENVPYEAITAIVRTAAGWTPGVRSNLQQQQQYIGKYYSQSDFDSYIADYDVFFANPANQITQQP
jgi:hypothetical protein